MRHSEDGNLAALDRHLDRMDEAAARSESVAAYADDLLRYEFAEIVGELGDDVTDCLARIYWDGAEGARVVRDIIQRAAEAIAERDID